MTLLASWVQRRVARPVLGALGGDVFSQGSNAPSFDPISILSSMPGLNVRYGHGCRADAS
jgi:hypothetical protein